MPDNTLQAQHANKYRFIYVNGEEETIDTSEYTADCIYSKYKTLVGVFNENKIVIKFHNITFTEEEIQAL